MKNVGWQKVNGESADGGLVDKARQAVVKCDRSEDLLRKYACIHSCLLVYDKKQLQSSNEEAATKNIVKCIH